MITAFLKAKQDNGDDLEKIIKTYMPLFLKDPGCIVCQAHRRIDNPNNFFFYDKFENDEALRFHSSTPHFKAMFSAIKPFLDGNVELAMYNEI